jgi:tetratricopeptide (TPR) repeat protein
MDAFERAANESAAIALMRAGNMRGAEARLRTMLSHNADDARALALLAHCRLGEANKREALEIARAAAAIDPDDQLVRSTLSHAMLTAGGNKKARQEAERIAEDIAAEDPEDAGNLFQLAIARFNNGDHLGARALFEDAEKHAADVHDLLNVAHLRLMEWNYAAAADLAQRAMMLDPTRAIIFRILAECALARKEPLEAYELALEALRLEPGEKETMRLMARARARSNPLLGPFLPGVDWIVEMDRRGLFVVPLLMLVVGGMLAVSALYDYARIAAGLDPAVILTAGLGVLFVYALVSYTAAITARMRIRRDLRKVQLPKF